MVVRLRIADESDARRWNEFVAGNVSDGYPSIYNLFEWRNILVKTYKYDAYYIVSEIADEIIGFFPLVYVRGSLLIPSRLISLPFTDYGCGPFARNTDKEILQVLVDGAKRIAKDLNVHSIKVCSPQSYVARYLLSQGYKEVYDYCAFILNLRRSEKEIWEGLEKRTRNDIYRAEKAGLTCTIDDTRRSVGDMFELHVKNVKRLGTPPHSFIFFDKIWREFQPKGLVKYFFAEYQGERIAGIMLLCFRDTVLWYAGYQLPELRSLNGISLSLWEAIKWSLDRGFKWFNLGGTRPWSGNFFYKRGWIRKNQRNGKIVRLHHLYLFLEKDGANHAVDIREPRYRILSSIWKLMPLKLTKAIGPRFKKEIAA